MGGIRSGRDAFEMVLAGASAVAVGTASFGNPRALIDIHNELKNLLIMKGFATLKDAVGFAHRLDQSPNVTRG